MLFFQSMQVIENFQQLTSQAENSSALQSEAVNEDLEAEEMMPGLYGLDKYDAKSITNSI